MLCAHFTCVAFHWYFKAYLVFTTVLISHSLCNAIEPILNSNKYCTHVVTYLVLSYLIN